MFDRIADGKTVHATAGLCYEPWQNKHGDLIEGPLAGHFRFMGHRRLRHRRQ